MIDIFMMVMIRSVIVMSVNIPHFDQTKDGGDYDELITIIINKYVIILTLPCEHMTLLNGATTSEEGDGEYNCAQSCQKDRGAQEAVAAIGHF